MQIDNAASCLEALGSSHRLGIYRLLVQTGTQGMTVGDIKNKLDMPSSTLSHHIAKLVKQGLIRQERESRSLICCCNYELMDELMHYLSDNCCRGDESSDECC